MVDFVFDAAIPYVCHYSLENPQAWTSCCSDVSFNLSAYKATQLRIVSATVGSNRRAPDNSFKHI